MPEDSWVVLKEHMLQTAWSPMDGSTAELLFLESVLAEAGIDAAFDPFRPGEGGGFTRSIQQPIRLLVKVSDLARAREIALDVADSRPPDGFADDPDEPEVSPPASAPTDDSFEGWFK